MRNLPPFRPVLSGFILSLFTAVGGVAEVVVTELAPSRSQTVSVTGTATELVSGGSWTVDGDSTDPYYVRERQASQLTNPLRTQLFFGFDLSAIDPEVNLLNARLVVHQYHKLNDLDAAGNASDLELAQVTAAWDLDGANYPIFDETPVDNAFIIGSNIQFGAPATSSGFFGGDPGAPDDSDGLIDITEMVIQWLEDPSSNHGLRLRMTNLAFTGAAFSPDDDPETPDQNEALRLIIEQITPSEGDSDGDGLDDDWETDNFDNLDQGLLDDPDEDGATNRQEFENGTDPNDPDSDGDGINDGTEIAFGLNPLLDDAGDDPDFDELTNAEEVAAGTDPNIEDTDGDGLYDGWEVANGTDPLRNDALEDLDGDGVLNEDEFFDGTFANNPDSDGDTLPDGWEFDNFLNGLDPSDAESDQDEDGLTALQEYENGSNPLLVDSDGDGLGDFDEVTVHMSSPALVDTDGDGLSDFDEVTVYGTNPTLTDTDEDGFTDREEIVAGLDPNVANDFELITSTLSIDRFVVAGSTGTNTDPANVGAWADSGPYFVRERSVGNAEQLRSEFFFQFDLSGLDPDKPIFSARLSIFQIHRLNSVAANFSDLELGRMAEPWDLDGENFPVFGQEKVEEPFVFGTNIAFGPDAAAMGFYGGDPDNPEDTDGQVDITVTVRRWLNGTSENHGLRMRMTDRSNTAAGFGFEDNPETMDQNEELVLIIRQLDTDDPRFIDSDGDGLTNFDETETHGTDPRKFDSDDDGIDDGTEIRVGLDPNVNDANDDPDGDGLTNAEEVAAGTDFQNPDTDEDGVGDGYEVANGMNPQADDAGGDLDGDGLTNSEESDLGTFANNPDSDEDGMPDGYEWEQFLNPLDAADASLDEDEDGLTTVQEYEAGTDPNLADTDGDGLTDFDEVMTHMTDPTLFDTDGDGLSDQAEVETHGTDPRNADGDGDGLSDGVEIGAGLDPTTPTEVTETEETTLDIAEFLTVGVDGTEFDPASMGAWGDSGNLYVRERRPNDGSAQLKTHLFLVFDLSGLNPELGILSAQLRIHQHHRLNNVAANIGHLAIGRVIDPWDSLGENYPTYLDTRVADEFIFGRNDDFGTDPASMGFFGGDPGDPGDDDGHVDVTSIVLKWFGDAADNLGFRLQMTDEEFAAVAFSETDNPETEENEALRLIVTQVVSSRTIEPNFVIHAALVQNSGDVELTWPSTPGDQFRVEYKTDLLDDAEWTLLETVPAAADAQSTGYTDATARDQDQRFYRVVKE